MARIKNATNNVLSGVLCNLSTILFSFFSRTVFIMTLGDEYMGIGSLFTNVLGVLAFTELGLGATMNFRLYKPLADNDMSRVSAYLAFYRRSYLLIGTIILILGCLLLPFIPLLVKEGGSIPNLRLYYMLFLLNSTISYFFVYKQTLLNADQKNYRLIWINMLYPPVKAAVQSVILILFRNYVLYLLIEIALVFLRNLISNIRIDRTYSFLNYKPEQHLDKKDTHDIFSDVKALLVHRFASVCVYQTDNILISKFVGLISVGIYSNYAMIITYLRQFSSIVSTSFTVGFGNVLITEDRGKSIFLFKTFNFLCVWIYSWTSICLLELFQPFITLWIGERRTLPYMTVFLIVTVYYLDGIAVPVENAKYAGGLYLYDRHISILQGISNLVVSLVLVFPYGINGIFIGTIVSTLVVFIGRAAIICRKAFSRSYLWYFGYTAGIAAVFAAIGIIQHAVNAIFLPQYGFSAFVLRAFFCLTLSNGLACLIFWRTEEFQYLKQAVLRQVFRRES